MRTTIVLLVLSLLVGCGTAQGGSTGTPSTEGAAKDSNPPQNGSTATPAPPSVSPTDTPAVQGPKGDPGPPGPTGLKGDTGPQGLQGPVGARGAVGDTGAVGSQGPMGPAGPQGIQGIPGPKGSVGAAGAGIALSKVYSVAPAYSTAFDQNGVAGSITYCDAGDMAIGGSCSFTTSPGAYASYTSFGLTKSQSGTWGYMCALKGAGIVAMGATVICLDLQ